MKQMSLLTKRFLEAIPAVWHGIVDALTNVYETVAFTFQATWERLTDVMGPYVIPVLYMGVALLILMVLNGH